MCLGDCSYIFYSQFDSGTPLQVMDMENEIQVLRAQFAEKASLSVQLRKEVYSAKISVCFFHFSTFRFDVLFFSKFILNGMLLYKEFSL